MALGRLPDLNLAATACSTNVPEETRNVTCSMAAVLVKSCSVTKPFSHLKRFGYDIREVRDVEVREIGAQHQQGSLDG